MDILKIFKDNEEMLRNQFCCAFNKVSEIEGIYRVYEKLDRDLGCMKYKVE